MGFEVIRLKTGTPPRVKRDSIDYLKTTIQPGDGKSYTFSFEKKYYEENPQEFCYLTHTSLETHEIISTSRRIRYV